MKKKKQKWVYNPNIKTAKFEDVKLFSPNTTTSVMLSSESWVINCLQLEIIGRIIKIKTNVNSTIFN